jgi:presenilin enhancer 2
MLLTHFALRFRHSCSTLHILNNPLADVVKSAIGFSIFAAVLLTWATTFIVGGERLFGPVWNDLVMYNVADKLGLTGFMG